VLIIKYYVDKELIVAQDKRLLSKFNEKEIVTLDKAINKICNDIILKIRDIEEEINVLKMTSLSNQNQIAIRDNMKKNLIYQLQEFSKKLKVNQESYMKKYQELVGDKVIYTNYDDKKSQSTGDQSFLQQSNKGSNEMLNRGKEIDSLINSITELGSVMKDFQALVFEQGTILDRIDYNVEVALDNTKKGYEDLKKADENLKSNCFRNTSLIIMCVILVEIILLIIKYS
jgi:syntaxin 16